ncbi:MAG: nuclear transport factor 2 family protein [Chitinophagales bacterium]|nr:nuclear transport factor 2 family protein [Chitinophagales bacterium]
MKEGQLIEKISFVQNIAIVMGHDIVKPKAGMENAGKTVTRRYTDIWMKDGDGWRLTARQATIISVQ